MFPHRPARPRSKGGDPALLTETEAKKRALASLGQADRSSASLRRRLLQWGFPDDVCERVVENLVVDGWISDERYASNRAQTGLRRGWGPRRLKQDLQTQGVAAELTAVSVEALEVDWDVQALELARKALARGKSPDQTARWLAGRGFATDVIRRALRAVGSED